MTSAVAIIPARGGSRRIPGKNHRLFHGQPIIAYSIQAAQVSGLFDLVVVSTDSDHIGDIAEIYGASVLKRDEEHSADAVGTQAVARNVLEELAASGMKYDLACVIYATAPLMSVEDLKRGMTELEDQQAVFAMSVGTEPLSDAAQFYLGVASAFGNTPLIDTRTVMIHIDPARVCDINTEQDWQKAEQMYAKLKR